MGSCVLHLHFQFTQLLRPHLGNVAQLIEQSRKRASDFLSAIAVMMTQIEHKTKN